MFNYVCSLKVDEESPQIIPKNTWTIVGFPYSTESSDEWSMHEPPAGAGNWKTDLRSGLVIPAFSGWGLLAGMVQFADSGDATEFRTQFARNPLSSTAIDTTATTHWATSPGGDYFATCWPFYLRPDSPVALRVYHNASTSLELSLAEFKVLI